MTDLVTGTVWKYGNDVNTDIIFPGKYTYTISDPQQMAQHALEDLDPTFASGVKPGDVIVAGKNWGNGSSREQAVVCLKMADISAVIAESFGRIWYRNAINQGLLALTCPEAVAALQKGDQVTINLEKGQIISERGLFTFPPFPERVRAILADGGLISHLKAQMARQDVGKAAGAQRSMGVWENFSLATLHPHTPAQIPVSQLDLVILVGVTGVGKSRTLAELQAKGHAFTLLPDRRLVTDQIIIASLQRQDGLTPQAVTDRRARFAYTARYRRSFPGGMAHALTEIWVDMDQVSLPLIFDGLRGLNEVQYAVEALPKSRFVILDAPDMVRLKRLLSRGDRFDTITPDTSDTPPERGTRGKIPAPDNVLEALQKISDLEAVFDAGQIQTIASLAGAEMMPLSEMPSGVEEVIQKVSIIVEERRNYDPEAAKRYLGQTLPPERCLIIDTATSTPEAVAEQIARWL